MAHLGVITERQDLPYECHRLLPERLRVADVAIDDFIKPKMLAMPEFLRQLVGSNHNLTAHGILRVPHTWIDVVVRNREAVGIRLAGGGMPVYGGRNRGCHDDL